MTDADVQGAAPPELVAQALEAFERDGRAAFDAVCERRPEHAGALRRRLDALIGFGLMPQPSARGVPQRLGRFAIRGVLGSGGMGVVYLARDDKLGRDVALKTLPPHLYGSTRTHERFAREVRAVAQLRHPGIVSIYELDEEGGVPFFSMEYVRGETLAAVLERVRALGLAPERLAPEHLWPALEGAAPSSAGRRPRSHVEAACRVAIDVARALAHAHEHGVVHRDVKPANVLLAADGGARLFDFGLAQVASEDKLTLTGDVIGTYAYMSPEQVAGSGDDLDARTDVFSLGVTLYELLALRTPFAGANAQQVMRQIASKEPLPLRRLNPAVPADLQTICATALEKDRERRYATAVEFADDLQRLLDLRPISARPASAWTRTQRFVRRNPALAAAAALGATVLVGVPIGLAVANHYLVRERDRANEASESSERMLAFLLSLFELADEEELGPDVAARALLEQGSHWLLEERQLTDQPRTRARLMATLGSIFWMMSDLERADALLSKALEIQSATLGREHVETARTLNYLGNVRRAQGRNLDAEPLLREALASFRREYGDAHRDTRMVLGNLGTLLAELGREDDGIALCRRVLELQDAANDVTPRERVEARVALASTLLDAGERDEAEPLLSEALRMCRGVEHVDVYRGGAEMGLGRVAFERGRMDEAEEHFAAAVAIYGGLFRDASSYVGIALRRLGDAHIGAGEFDEALPILSHSAAALREALGPDHPELARTLWSLGYAFTSVSDHANACSTLAEAMRIFERPQAQATAEQSSGLEALYGETLLVAERNAEAVEVLERYVAHARSLAGGPPPNFASMLVYLGLAYTRSGRAQQGEAQLCEAREVLERLADVPARQWVSYHGALGECLTAQRRFDAAEVELADAFERMPAPDQIHPLLVRRTFLRLIDLYVAWGRADDAQQWRDRLASAGR